MAITYLSSRGYSNNNGTSVLSQPTGTGISYLSSRGKAEEEEKNIGGLVGGIGYLGEKLAVGTVSSIEGISDYTFSGLAKLFGNDAWAEDIIANDWFGDWYSHPEEWFNPGKGWQVAGDVAGGIGTSIPGIAASVGAAIATGGASLAVQGVAIGGASFLTAGLGAAGRATNEAYKQTGQLTGKEYGYGALVGATEGGIEGLTNIIGIGSGAVVKSFTKAIGKETAEAFTKQGIVKTLGSSFLGEAFEESASEILNPYWQRATYDPNAKNASVDEVLYAGIVGGLSGMVMGGTSYGIDTTKSFISGNRLAQRGGETEVLNTAADFSAFEEKNNTGDELFSEIISRRNELLKSLETTGGKAVRLDQQRDLGALERANVAAASKMFVAKRAQNIVNNADTIAKRLTSYGYKNADGTPITYTADQLTAGYDKTRPQSIYKALSTNSTLRSLAVADATGQLMMDTAQFKQKTLTGERLASQSDLNRFVQQATPKEVAAVSKALKIDSWSGLTAEAFNQKIIDFVNDGGVERTLKTAERKKEFASIPVEQAQPVPRIVNLGKDGVRRYSDGKLDIAVERRGNDYTVYDYNADTLSRGMSKEEVNSVFRDYAKRNAENKSTISAITQESQEHQTRIAEIQRFQNEVREVDNFAREHVKEYAKLSEPSKDMVKNIIVQGRSKGISDSDLTMYARVSAHSGIDIQFDKEATYRGTKEDGSADYANGFYEASKNRIVVNPEGKKTAEKLLIHELDHAIRKYFDSEGKSAARIYFDAIEGVDQATRDKILGAYKKTAKPGEVAAVVMDETNAYYAEQVLGNKYTLEKLLEAEPTLKDKILSFFKGASTDYSDVPKLSNAAKKYYKTYKKLFDEFSARNAENNAIEKPLTSINDKNMQVSGRDYAVVAQEDGKLYVTATRKVIKSTTLEGQRKEISHFFDVLLEGQPSINIHTIEGDVLTITKAVTADKARDNYKTVQNKRVKLSDDEFRVKLNAEAHIDELAEISTSKPQKAPDSKNHSFAKDGFTYRTAYFEDFDGKYYRVTLSIGNNGTVATVYNVGEIKENVPSSAKIIAVMGSKALDETFSDISISQKSKKSNSFDEKKYSSPEEAKDSGKVSDAQFSLEFADSIAEKQRRIVSDGLSKISSEELEQAIADTAHMVNEMKPYANILPQDKVGKTLVKNGSYDVSVENTTVCIRTLAYNSFVDMVSEKVGRPLTQMESFLVSQKLYEIAKEPQCLYCYVSLDRKAFNEMVIRYTEQRDAAIEAYEAAGKPKIPSKFDAEWSLFKQFLDGRKATANMWDRYVGWLNAYNKGERLVSLSDISTEAKRLALVESGGEVASQVKDILKYAQSASWAKKQTQYVAYYDEILKLKPAVIRNLNNHYGMRWYSFSDYSGAFIVENMQQITDAAIRGLKGLSYTKDTDFAEIFAPTGMNINISVYAMKNGKGGYEIDAKQSANIDEAIKLREQYPNVGIVVVATDKAGVEWALAQEWSDVVIPFHTVRTGADVAEFYNWEIFNSEQSDTVSDQNLWDKYVNEVGKKKASKMVYPSEHQNNKDTYLKIIEERGLKPRFSSFLDNPNYMKLVNETRQSESETTPLKAKFNIDAAERSFDKFVEKGGYYEGWYNDGIDVDGEAEIVAEDVKAGKKANEVDYGRQDIRFEDVAKGRKTTRYHGRQYSIDIDSFYANGEEFATPTLSTVGKERVSYEEKTFSKEWRKTKSESAYIHAVDEMYGIQSYLEKVGKSKNAKATIQTVRSTPHQVQTMIGSVQYNIFKGDAKTAKKMGEGLNEIFRPIEKMGEKATREFNDYLLHQLNVDKYNANEKMKRLQEDAVESLHKVQDEIKAYEKQKGNLEKRIFELGNSPAEKKLKEGNKKAIDAIDEKLGKLKADESEMLLQMPMHAEAELKVVNDRISELMRNKNKIKQDIFEAGNSEDAMARKKELREKAREIDDNIAKEKELANKLQEIVRLHDYSLKPVFNLEGTTITKEESERFISKYELTHPEFKKAAEKVWKFSKNLNEMRVDSQLISRSFAQRMATMYPHYVPSFRSQINNTAVSDEGLSVSSTVKKAKGYNNNIMDVKESIASQVAQVARNGNINILANKVYDTAANTGDSKYVDIGLPDPEGAEISREGSERPKPHILTFFKNGKEYQMNVSDEIYAGFKGVSEASAPQTNVFARATNWITDKYKKLVTSMSPAFMIRNAIRDLQDAGLNSKHPLLFAKSLSRAWIELVNNSENWQTYRAYGGFSSTVFESKGVTGNVDERGFEILGIKDRIQSDKELSVSDIKYLKSLFTGVENVNAAVEQIPRFAEYLASIEAGETIEQAIYNSAEVTTNFGRRGATTKQLNSTIIPFLNPAIQGFDKIFRNVSDAAKAGDAKQVTKAMGTLLGKAILIGMLPMLFNSLMYDDDEDYKDLREEDKENNYLIKLPNGTFIKLPRGRVASVIAGIANRGLKMAKGEDPDWEEYLSNVVSQVTPVENLTRTVFSPFMDVANNRTWYGTEIEGQQFENVRPEDRYDESTSSIAIAIGKVTKYSPKKIHYLIDQYSGVIGDFLLPATTQKAEKDFFSGNFTLDPVTSNKISNQFYKIYDEAQYSKTDGDVKAQYQVKYLNKVKSATSELYKEINAIQNSDLSSVDKLQQTRVLRILINEALKNAIADYEQIGRAIDATANMGFNDADTGEANVRYAEIIRQVYGSERALSEYNGTVYSNMSVLNSTGLSYDTLYNYYFRTKEIKSDIDANGNTISGSKRAKIVSVINGLGVSVEQRLLLICASGYALKDGDIRGVSAEAAKTRLLKYILRLRGLTADERLEIAEMCNFEVRNGRIVNNFSKKLQKIAKK